MLELYRGCTCWAARQNQKTQKTPNIANIRTLQKIFNEINDLQAPLMFCIVLTTLFFRTIGTKALPFSILRREFPEHCMAYRVEMTVPWGRQIDRVVIMSLGAGDCKVL